MKEIAFFEKQLLKETGAESFSQGKKLWLDGKVRLDRFNEDYTQAEGQVEEDDDSSLTSIDFVLEDDSFEIDFAECSCEHNHFFCKHVVALALESLNQRSMFLSGNSKPKTGSADPLVLEDFSDITLPVSTEVKEENSAQDKEQEIETLALSFMLKFKRSDYFYQQGRYVEGSIWKLSLLYGNETAEGQEMTSLKREQWETLIESGECVHRKKKYQVSKDQRQCLLFLQALEQESEGASDFAATSFTFHQYQLPSVFEKTQMHGLDILNEKQQKMLVHHDIQLTPDYDLEDENPLIYFKPFIPDYKFPNGLYFCKPLTASQKVWFIGEEAIYALSPSDNVNLMLKKCHYDQFKFRLGPYKSYSNTVVSIQNDSAMHFLPEHSRFFKPVLNTEPVFRIVELKDENNSLQLDAGLAIEGRYVPLSFFANGDPLQRERTILFEKEVRKINSEVLESVLTWCKKNCPDLIENSDAVYSGEQTIELFTLVKLVLAKSWTLMGHEHLKDLLVSNKDIINKVEVFEGKEPGAFEFKVSPQFQEALVQMPQKGSAQGAYIYLEQQGKFIDLEELYRHPLWSFLDEVGFGRAKKNSISVPFWDLGLIRSIEDKYAQVSWSEDLQKRFKSIFTPESFKNIVLPETGGLPLRDYQKTGVRWMSSLSEFGLHGILADDMGLGKTAQTLNLLVKNKQEGRRSLLVCPTSVLHNWVAETERFTPSLSTQLIYGKDRHEILENLETSTADILITNYPCALRDFEILKKVRWHYLILDEAHYIKNPKSKSTQVIKSLEADYRVALSGTPMENRPSELWSLFDFLMPGFLGSYSEFRAKYEIPIVKHESVKAQEQLAKKVKPWILRRLKNQVAKELPPKTEQVLHVEMEDEQNIVYQRLLAEMRSEINETIEEKGFERSRIQIFAALTKLRQICCHPHLIPTLKKMPMSSAKFIALFDLIEKSIASGHRIIVFSQFVQMLKMISEELNIKGIEHFYLDGQTKDRQTLVDDFNAGNIPVFLLSLKAGGTGLNLTGADTVIHYDPWWNPAVEDQATDRSYRIGQTKPVFAYKLITQNSIEEKILQMQHKKRKNVQNIIGDENNPLKAISQQEMLQLLE